MRRLKAQLPIMSPTAILGTRKISMELTPVKSSGNEVTADIKIKPNHAFPIPVREVIISPYLESFAPLKIIIEEHAINPDIVNINACITHGKQFLSFYSSSGTTSKGRVVVPAIFFVKLFKNNFCRNFLFRRTITIRSKGTVSRRFSNESLICALFNSLNLI